MVKEKKVFRKPRIRKRLVEEPKLNWDQVSRKIIEDAENGLLTISEAQQKLHNSFRQEYADPDGNYMEPVYELEDLEKKNKFKSLNVHGTVYEDLVTIAKEDNRSIASTVALITKDYRYARREKRKMQEQLKKLQNAQTKTIFS